jgi:hypothetical protein
MGDSVFHYTNIEGLIGILSSRALIATHYNYLNDLNEGGAIRKLIIPIFESEISDFTPKLIERGWLKKGIYERYGIDIHRVQAEKTYAAMLHTTDNITPFFVASFCKHVRTTRSYQNGLLSQWRGYGSTAGFAIEFDADELDNLIKLENGKHAYSVIKSDYVRYKTYEELFKPDIYKGVAGELTKHLFAEKRIDITEIVGTKNLNGVYPDFVTTAPFLKDENFEEENEYRIVAVCFRSPAVNTDEKRSIKPINFRSRNNMITPFVKLFSDLNHSLPIKAIIIGPHQQQQRQLDAVEMIAEAHGMKFEIRLSSIPFRM